MKKVFILIIAIFSIFTFSMHTFALENNISNNILILDKEKSASEGESDDFLDICSSSSRTLAAFKLGGIFIFIAKIIAPIILIVMGMIDIAKAVPEGKDDAIKKSFSNFLKRVVAAVLIFFTPALVDALFTFVDGWDNTRSEFSGCMDCLLKPGSCNAQIVNETNSSGNTNWNDAGGGKRLN